MIIHNPEITGSLIFPRTDGTKVVMQISSQGVLETVEQDATGSVTGNIPESNFSGSFTGSFKGDGSQITGVAASSLDIDLFNTGVIAGNDYVLFADVDDSGTEKRGTFKSGVDSVGAISSSEQVVSFLPAGTVSGSIQVDVEQTTNFTSFSSSIASTFAGLTSEFNEITNNPFSQSASLVTVSKSIIPTTETIDLGTVANPFRDLYLSSASLYVDGTQVISSNTNELIITTDTNQSLKLIETGADTVQIQTENGDITFTATGTGNIELDAPIQIVAGNQILSSDGNAIAFGEDIDITGNITLSGTVDGVDVNLLKTSFDTLEGKTLVSSSAQITDGSGLVSGSIQVDVEQTTNFTAFSSSIASTFAGLSSNYADLVGIPSGIVSGSDQLTGSLMDLSTDQTIGGTKTFNNIVVNGTGSFAYLESTQGSAKIIGDAFIVLNNDTPTQRYAGVSVYDSGSAGVTASLQFDGQENDWFYQYSDDGGVTVDHGVVLFGPEYATQGSPTYPTNNTIQKGNGGHHLLDSNITDDGSTITLSSATTVTGVTTISNSTASTSTTTGALKVTGGVGVGGDIFAGADIVAYASSDERLKDNVELISDPIGKVQSLKGVTWEWNDNASEAAKQSPNLGVIAQDVEKVLPQLVHDRENGYKGVDYAKLTGLLIEAIKEQQKQIDDLKSRLG